MAKKDNKKGTKKVSETKKKGTSTTTKKEQVKKQVPVKEEKKTVTKVEETKEKVVKEETKIKPEEKKEEKQPKKCNKGFIYIACGVVVIVLIILVLFMIKNNNKNKIENSIINMGEQFYTEYYYPQITKNKSKKDINEILSKFEKNGIKINLKNLSIFKGGTYKKEIDSFKNKNKECDKEKSKVIIKPTKPYGKTDYKIEVQLDCGF